MEESELEEGEACSYNNNNDYGGYIDPDTDLSYIDEKLHNVLGHFQKDFEGGVSAENLGAKFGGYGSFLPTYQRSPIWSHPKTPAKPQNCPTPKSPNNLTAERGNTPSSIVPKKVRPGHASSSFSSRSTSKAISSTGSANAKKLTKSKKSNHAEPSNSMEESANKKPVIFSKQNSLKLRIKVGSDNLAGGKNAAIYSGLGLDVSPSSSLDNSLSENDGMNCEPQNSPFESPTSILMVMTSLPVEGHLLSPLSDELIRFVEREKVPKADKYTPPSWFVTESSHAMVNCSEPKYGEEKPLAEKKIKAAERKTFSAEANGRNKKDFSNGTDNAGKKEIETDTSYPTVDTTKSSIKLFDASEEKSNGAGGSKVVGDGERGLWVPTHHKDLGLDENPRTSSAGSVQEDKKTSSLDGASDYSRKEGKHKGRRISSSAKDSGASKEKNWRTTELEDSLRKQKACQRDDNNEQNVARSLKEQEPQLSSGGKMKLKENRISSMLETKKNDRVDYHTTRKEGVSLKPPKDARKAEDTYKDFFGVMEESEEEDNGCSLDVKGSWKSDKGVTAVVDISEKTSFPLKESKPKEVQNAAPPILSKPGSDASLANLNPVLIQEHWVACDKCGKWRLLPLGILPKDLPEKWLCTMLNWLPKMNKCEVPEDETTKALLAMHQVPAPNTQAAMQSNPIGINSQFKQGDDFTKKRKKGPKEITNGMGKEGSQTAETNKKTAQASARNGSINHSNFVNQSNLGRLSDMPEDKQKHKQKEKTNIADQHSDGGDSRSLKIKSKRDADRESYILAKKMKTESFLFPNQDQGFGYGGIKHGCPSSSGGVPAVSTDNDRGNYFDHLKESETDKKHKPQVSSKRPKEEGVSDTGNSDGTESKRKRKLRDSHGSQVFKEELSGNKNQEQKKARISKYEEKESSFSKGNAKLEKKSKSHSKREFGHVQNSIIATSSSSKISDSHKAKNGIHEGKGSPVESVSSSPIRISDPEKSGSIRRKKEHLDANILSAVSLRRFSDGEEDGGSDRSQTQMKEKHGSHEPPVLDFWDKESSLKAKASGEPSSLAAKKYDFDNGGQSDLPRKLDNSHEEGRQANDHRHSNGSLPRKSGKGSSSRSKDKNQSIRSDSQDGPGYVEKKKYEGNIVKENVKGGADVGAHGSPNSRVDSMRPNIPKHFDVSERPPSEKSNKTAMISERESSQSRPPSRGVQEEASIRHSSLISAPKKVDKCGTTAGNSSQADDVSKASAQIRRKNNSSTSLQNEHSPSPLRKELSSSQAAHNALKEAKDLKHTADRLKKTVSNFEHIELYFQACLKFLHGASLLEMSSNESARQGETIVQSMKIYSSTANLCGFCAREYEKSKDMGAAALAYKCMEVAYMRVVNSSYTSANRYRNELQTSLQMVPPGESPSSSASDVDNVNHLAAADKVGTSKGVNSPLVAGNHIITAQNRSNLLRLLQFAQDVSLAMDASRKSRVALAASIGNLGETQQGEGILSIKRALDYNFQDIEGLLRLVRLAMEANNR